MVAEKAAAAAAVAVASAAAAVAAAAAAAAGGRELRFGGCGKIRRPLLVKGESVLKPPAYTSQKTNSFSYRLNPEPPDPLRERPPRCVKCIFGHIFAHFLHLKFCLRKMSKKIPKMMDLGLQNRVQIDQKIE